MFKFHYKLVTKNGKIEEGYTSSFLKKLAEKKLSKDGSVVVFIELDRDSTARKTLNFFSFSSFSTIEKINFFKNFSMMNMAGLSMISSLDVLAEQIKNNRVRDAVWKIIEDVKNGQRLSKAMSKFRKYFPEYTTETINMGERSGRLSETLNQISIDLEKDDDLQKKVIGAIAYPSIIVCVMIVVVVFLMLYILPKVAQLYEELNAQVPFFTRILLSFGSFLTKNPFLLPIIIFLVLVGSYILLQFKKGKYFFNYLTLKLPIFGEFIKDYNLVLFFRSLSSLLKSGVSLVDAVEVSKKTTKNETYRKIIDNIKPLLIRGVPLSTAISSFPFFFPTQIRKTIEVGEETGKMEETFTHITNYYERSVDYKTKIMTVLIEPVVMLILAFLVGGMALSLFLPLYNIANVM